MHAGMRLWPMLLVLAAAGCAKTSPPVAAPPPPSTVGLEKVLGATPQTVIQLIGSPTLDRQEGKGRHLQFTRGACVLDLFFYAPAQGGEPVATYADARMKDGGLIDTASCLQLQQRAQPLT